MAIKRYKPITPGTRFKTVSAFEEITTEKPERSLVVSKNRKGGGNKQKYRIIDFKRDKDNIPAKVAEIEYDPNRTANIALLHYADGEKRYILAPLGLAKGDTVVSGENADIKAGNALPLSAIPVGTMVHNVEMQPGRGGQMVRTAGAAAQLMAREGKYATLKLPSGEMRMVPAACKATVGQVGNLDHELVSVGKAGRKRRRHEPVRSPARRRRRQVADRPSLACHPVGQTHARL